MQYFKSFRGFEQAADPVGLHRHLAPLVGLAKVAPSGFPLFNSLRAALILFDKKYSILPPDTAGKSRHNRAGIAADVWRKMLKDAVNIHRSKDSSEKRV